MNTTKQILTEKMNSSNPFISELRDYNNQGIVWISDKEGTFELEMIIPEESDWNRIVFNHNDIEYDADVNIYIRDNGSPRVGVYAVQGARTMGEEFVVVEPVFG